MPKQFQANGPDVFFLFLFVRALHFRLVQVGQGQPCHMRTTKSTVDVECSCLLFHGHRYATLLLSTVSQPLHIWLAFWQRMGAALFVEPRGSPPVHTGLWIHGFHTLLLHTFEHRCCRISRCCKSPPSDAEVPKRRQVYGKRIGRICLQNDQGYESVRVLPVPGRRFCDMLGCVMCFHLYECLVKCEFCAVTYEITQRSIFYVSFAF